MILIFAMSILIMGFAVTIYSTHKNWKDKAEVLQKENEQLKSQIDQIIVLRDDLEKKLYEEVIRKANAISTLQSKVEVTENENKTLLAENNRLSAERQENVSAVVLSGKNMEQLRAELEVYRSDFREAQARWAELYSTLVAKTDEAHSLAMDLAAIKSVGIQLAKDYKNAVDVLRKHGLLPMPELYSGSPPHGVHGRITQVRDRGWVEISIGSDSGLLVGHKLDIVRKGNNGRAMLIGKLKIDSVEADRAVAVVMPEFRRGTVQKDDIVEVVNTDELTVK
ncbi:MAG: hypothetical protein LBQ66_04280 [Planctomycetaceae bacterium]|nr:hypothetical protein [Planctomycetaceae bacterium]